jgi:hypothetical protein
VQKHRKPLTSPVTDRNGMLSDTFIYLMGFAMTFFGQHPQRMVHNSFRHKYLPGIFLLMMGIVFLGFIASLRLPK